MSADSTLPPKEDLATRFFNNTTLGLLWIIFLGVVVTRFWHVRDVVLVWWVYGRDAYFRDGVRVLSGKPSRFSTGELVPTFPNVITGFAFFFIVVFGLSMLLIQALRLYERFRKSKDATP